MRRCLHCGHLHDASACPQCGDAPRVMDGFECHAPALARHAPGYDPAHYEQLSQLEAGNFWFQSRNRLILDAIRRHAPDAGRYLEIGCGTGFVLGAVARAFPDMACSGSEIFTEGLGIAATRAPGAQLFQMDARSIPFVSHFDLVGAFDVLEHIEDDETVIRQVHDALRSGGKVVLTVPQHPFLWSAQDEAAHHVRRYMRGELEQKLQRHGFRLLASTSFVTLLMPALIASRRVAQRSTDDPFAEFRIPRWLNAALEWVMRAEAMLIKAGLRMPIGGSRLVVAERIAA